MSNDRLRHGIAPCENRDPPSVTSDDRPAPPDGLLGPGDPAPFRIVTPQGRARFLLVCDHAGRAVPERLGGLGIPPGAFDRHIAFDPGAAEIAGMLSARFDAPAVLCGYSRLVIDVNRRLWDPTVMPEISDGTDIPANAALTAADRLARVRAIFLPYHGAVADRIATFHTRGIVPALVAIHSFTPRFQGRERPWHIGVMWDRDDRIARPLIRRLRAIDGLTVGDNAPYSGKHPADYTIDHHGEAAGLPCVGVEIRQDLLTDAPGRARWAALLGDALADCLAPDELYRLRDL